MTKGEKAMGETLKRVAKECKDDDVRTQMNKIKREFLGKRVVGLPESVMRVLSMWFMQKSRKVVQVNTNMKAERVSLPKPSYKLSELDDDDEDVFATSIIDRYAARPNIIANMCLAEFAVSYDPVAKCNYGNDELNCDSNICEPLVEHCNVADVTMQSTVNARTYQRQQTIKLKDGLGYMRKRKRKAILRTRRYKEHAEPEKYYHAKLLLYYPWENEDVLICGHATYHESYLSKTQTILMNAKKFNDNCHIFDLDPSEIDDAATQSIWELAAPGVAQDDAETEISGFKTLQKRENEDIACDPNQALLPPKGYDTLSQLYTSAAKHQHMSLKEYCANMRLLNEEQRHIVMYNRAWCKSYIQALRKGTNVKPYRIFISGPGGTGKTFIVNMIKRDIPYFLKSVVNAGDDQPMVLVTAPTGSAAFQVGGSTIHSAFLLYDKAKAKTSWEKYTTMQLKLEHLMLSLTDEISMVGFKKFQEMNQTMCHVKGTTDGDWGGVCVIAVGDLYQLPPVGECPIYSTPKVVTTLNDFASNGWEDMHLHELTQIMRQKDVDFANCLNRIRMCPPEENSADDLMLRSREIFVAPDHESYPLKAMHVYCKNISCDEWNNKMLSLLSGHEYISHAVDSKKDTGTGLSNIALSGNPRDTGNLRKIFRVKIGAHVMITTNIDVADGLTNGAMGTVVNIVYNDSVKQVKAIFVKFDHNTIGENAIKNSTYHCNVLRAVPIEQMQVNFSVDQKASCQANRRQFPLTLAWAVTIHKCQGLTMDEIVVDMTPKKGKYTSGQAYVAFSRVKELKKLHIIKYTREQIRVSKNVAAEMDRLRRKPVPRLPEINLQPDTSSVSILHINVGGLWAKKEDVQQAHLFQKVDVISLNETHLPKNVSVSCKSLGISNAFISFNRSRDENGGGIALLIHKKLLPKELHIACSSEIVGAKVSEPFDFILLCIYRPPNKHICDFVHDLCSLVQNYKGIPLCIIGDFNEDIFLKSNCYCYTKLMNLNLKQLVDSPTRDSGSLIDHMYISPHLVGEATVIDCYFSDHDFVFGSIKRL